VVPNGKKTTGGVSCFTFGGSLYICNPSEALFLAIAQGSAVKLASVEEARDSPRCLLLKYTPEMGEVLGGLTEHRIEVALTEAKFECSPGSPPLFFLRKRDRRVSLPRALVTHIFIALAEGKRGSTFRFWEGRFFWERGDSKEFPLFH
jgi:hypothetical protein